MQTKRNLFMLIICIFLCVIFVPKLEVHADIEDTKKQIEEAEAAHSETKEKIKETQENIDALSNTKDTLVNKLDTLNKQLTEVSENLADLESKILAKEKEITETEADLEEAIAEEEAQYAAMKKRIQFMYEQKNQTYAELLFTSKSFGEFINKNTYIEQLSDYDRKMLIKFQQTREMVEDTKAKLESEKAELDEYYAQVEAEQAKVSGYVSETSSTIGVYKSQIKNAEAVADAYAAQAEEEAKNIAALKKKLAEEIALSKLAAQSSWRDISEVSFQEGDRYLLANLIYCEAGNQPYAGQLAVGAVVINRVLSSVYPNTVVGVIYQNKQFSPVGDGHLALALAENRATAACYKAADEAMAGQTNVGHCVYFRTPIEGLSGIQIGAHIFY